VTSADVVEEDCVTVGDTCLLDLFNAFVNDLG
jgi:uncharacterized protein YuzB (UPF0349 family)